jgi:GxxExxY protein
MSRKRRHWSMIYGDGGITCRIIGCAMTVHSALGPGLLESAYRVCLTHELKKHGMKVDAEVELPLIYDGVRLDVGYRLDILVEGAVVLELKAVEELAPIHKAQLISYLKVGGYPAGLLINFNVVHLKDGIKRVFPHGSQQIEEAME